MKTYSFKSTINTLLITILLLSDISYTRHNIDYNKRYQEYLHDMVIPRYSERSFLVLEHKENKEEGDVYSNSITPRHQKLLPAQFRTMRDTLMPVKKNHRFLKQPNIKGLKEVAAVGSAQFTPETLPQAFSEIKILYKNFHIAVLDLRREGHGFVNGHSAVLFVPQEKANFGKSSPHIIADEKKELSELPPLTNLYKKKKPLSPSYKIPQKTNTLLSIQEVTTEKELVESLGGHYFRIPIQNLHRPNDYEVDNLLQIVQNLKPNTVTYVHCAAGKGRTTTAMAMLDMMKNSHHVTFDDIITRQLLLGGTLLNEHKEFDYWDKAQAHQERLIFLQNFYQYCRSPVFGKLSWREWLKQQRKTINA